MRITPKQPKTVRLSVAFSEREQDAIKTAATATGVTVSEFIRQVVMQSLAELEYRSVRMTDVSGCQMREVTS